jgi:hypothetical protein
VSRPVCIAARNDGGACRAQALPGDRWCWCHHPDRQEQAAEARARGRAKVNTLRALKGRRVRLERTGQLARWLSDLIVDVLEGKTPPDIGRTCMYGASVLRQVVETAELERRLAALEQAAAGREAMRERR